MSRTFTTLALGALALLAAGCASIAPPAPVAPPPLVLHDELFPEAALPADAEHLFDLSPAMQAYVDANLRHPGRGQTPLSALAWAMSHDDMLHLAYDASHTRTAAQAFDERAGNCLSLVILTAALARELDLRVEFQQAEIDPYWSRNGKLLLASEHINVTVLPPLRDIEMGRDPPSYVFDFLESREANTLPRHDVGERTVEAMFLNNRAAEALQADRPALAYAYARAAIRADSGYAPAYNTLGVVYRSRGAGAPAVAAFRAALARDAQNTRTLRNLVDALHASGEQAEADRLAGQLALLEPEPPFHYFDLGVAAYQRHDYSAAQALFRREATRIDYSSELHFWMARTAWALGKPSRAQREIEQAMARSITSVDRTRYAAKLEWLREQVHLKD